MALMGMMSAITIILACTPLGLIPLPVASASTVHIPTVITAVVAGPVSGAVVGVVLGLTTLIRALTAPVGILDPYFVNPLISVLPRALIGLCAGWVYRAMKAGFKREFPSCLISGAVGSAVNTAFVMGLLYVLYARDITAKMGQAAGPVFIGVVTTSGALELICTAVITAAVVPALKKTLYVTSTK